jgi:hypothetical protein
MLGFHIIILAMLVGGIASKGNARSAFLYIPVAGLGAIIGAFIAFGNVPFLVDNGFLNPFLSSLFGSLIFVTVSRALKKGWTKILLMQFNPSIMLNVNNKRTNKEKK